MLLLGLVSCFSLIMWQHLGRLWFWSYKPSDILTYIAIFSEYFCTTVGEIFAWCSSYLHLLYTFLYKFLTLHLKDLLISLIQLFEPVGRLVVSPVFFIQGYCQIALTYAHPALITVGSIVLIAAVLAVLWRRVLSSANRKLVGRIITSEELLFGVGSFLLLFHWVF